MSASRKFAAVAVVALALLCAAAETSQAQVFYSYYPRLGIVPGTSFWRNRGFVAVPPVPAPTVGPYSYGPAFLSTNQPPVGSFQNTSFGMYGRSLYGPYGAYAFPQYGAYSSPQYAGYTYSQYDAYAYPRYDRGYFVGAYTVAPFAYSTSYQWPAYYFNPLLYAP